LGFGATPSIDINVDGVENRKHMTFKEKYQGQVTPKKLPIYNVQRKEEEEEVNRKMTT